MYEWILILSLLNNLGYGGGAIHSVSGFASKEECLAAAAIWRKDALPKNRWSETSALCIKRTRVKP